LGVELTIKLIEIAKKTKYYNPPFWDFEVLDNGVELKKTKKQHIKNNFHLRQKILIVKLNTKAYLVITALHYSHF